MKVIQGTHEAPEEDFISTMPDDAITNILDRLPLQDAVRSAMLARNWRFKWTMLSQLVFDENFFKYLSKKEVEKKDYGRIISRILLHIKGGITKFVLYIDERCLDDVDVNHWFLFLSNKGVKDITLWKRVLYMPPHKLHTHLFSCLELKHLKLVQCCFDPPASFHGFPNLLSLELPHVAPLIKKLGKFFTQSPKLEILKLGITLPRHNVTLAEIAKLSNLKKLSMILFDPLFTITSSSDIIELMGSLPKLQKLHLDFASFEMILIEGVANKRFSIAFPCLKTLKLSRTCLDDGMKLSCAFELIRSCSNLQTLEITTTHWDIGPPPLEDYNTTGLLQLQSVMFQYLKGSENELCLLKYLLASSPFLKQVVIHSHSCSKITSVGKLEVC
ncbi:F-box/FBD/LRR-repeat protein At1g13570-like [Bidens hawaiensis]|uniref:F-box/FBD/LRR-repeat protein At1g13570-like n=1 Tax=Bidens hawaiensis TaxID=980011 RepID=UPI004049E2C2